MPRIIHSITSATFLPLLFQVLTDIFPLYFRSSRCHFRQFLDSSHLQNINNNVTSTSGMYNGSDTMYLVITILLILNPRLENSYNHLSGPAFLHVLPLPSRHEAACTKQEQTGLDYTPANPTYSRSRNFRFLFLKQWIAHTPATATCSAFTVMAPTVTGNIQATSLARFYL